MQALYGFTRFEKSNHLTTLRCKQTCNKAIPSTIHSMLTSVNPKLPMRDIAATRNYYVNQLGFTVTGDYGNYLIVEKDNAGLHFFLFENLNPAENYGQVYIRVKDIDTLYHQLKDAGVAIHPNAPLQTKPWGQREFALLDPDNNLLTFGEAV